MNAMELGARILHIDLTSGTTGEESVPAGLVLDYIGGRGLAAKLLFREVKPDLEPFSPDNVLIFAPGCLVGTEAPTAGRTTVVSKSPATGMYMKASMGGQWGAELKYAGYDLLVVRGRASKPTYLIITEASVRLCDAGHLWGLDVRETTERIEREVSIPGVSVACIGPAGENRVGFAAIMCSLYDAAARGGLGAVMGSKNLKALAVSGRIPVTLNDRQGFRAVCQQARESVASTGRCRFYYEYGTAGVVLGTNEVEAFPSYNFQRGSIEDAYQISGQRLTEEGFLKRRSSCFACTIACKRYSQVSRGEHAGSGSGGPEYETLAALGSGCGITEMEAVLRANELCNLYGLDTISTGSVIQWAMESRERGVLSNELADGLDLSWGNSKAMIALVEMIAFRRGLGDLLAEGVKRASEKIGGESWKWAVHAKGLEQSGVETRMAKAYALAFATNPRGPDHLYGQPMAEFGFSPEARALVKQLTGDEKYADPTLTEKKPEIVCWHEECFVITDSLGLCSRATLSTYAITPQMMARMYSATYGCDVSGDDLMRAARRVINLEKAFNVREGADRSLDTLPWRVMHEPLVTSRGSAINSPAEMAAMLDRYYELRGWDRETGWPKVSTLRSYGLDQEAEELASLGRIPSGGDTPIG